MEQGTRKKRPTKKVYVPQGKPVEITAVSRMAVKLRDDFYTFEAMEKRTLPENVEDINLVEEWRAAFDSVNATVDLQYQEAFQSVFEQKPEKNSSTRKKRTGQ